MRIPSGLSDGSLYRQQGRKSPASSPYRGLLRMVLALVLVLVAMRQAANPELFRVFFSEPKSYSSPPKTNANGIVNGIRLDQGNRDGYSDSTGDPLQTPPRQSRRKTIGVLTDQDRNALAKALTQARKSDADADADTVESLARVVRSAADLANESFASSATEMPLGDEAEKGSLQAGLDQYFLDQVSDGSIWKKADHFAFTRLLEDGIDQTVYLGERQAGAPKRVGVIPLLQQPQLYLRTRVAIGGQLARISLRQANENPFDVKDYYELWLQPDDGSQRPVAFYTAEIPDSLRPYLETPYLSDGPAMVLEGVYLKRLAFRSAEGSELAPVIVGGMYVDETTNLPIKAPEPSVSIAWLVISSAIIGIGIALAIFLTTRRAALKARSARLAALQFTEPAFDSMTSALEANDTK
jgi:hypothetical protein